MKPQDSKDKLTKKTAIIIIISMVVWLSIGYGAGFYDGQISKSKAIYNNGNVFELNTTVEGTGSMLPTIQKDSVLMLEQYEGLEPECGHIYIYEPNNYSKGDPVIVHRYVRKSPHGYIFKGDNNKAQDKPINNTQILYKITSIR